MKEFTLTLTEAEGRLLCDAFALTAPIIIGGGLGDTIARIAIENLSRGDAALDSLAGKMMDFQRAVKDI